MKTPIQRFPQILLLVLLGATGFASQSARAQTNTAIRIVALGGAGKVEYLQKGATHWQPVAAGTRLDPLDRVRTGTNSSVLIRWSDQSELRFNALTELEILPPEAVRDDHGLNLIRGLLYFFHRGPPGRIRVITSGALAGIKGTEFLMSVATVNGVEQTTLAVFDGQVSFGNAAGTLELTSHEQAVAEPGQAPMRSPGFNANNLLQWCFYYPGVLDEKDLPPAVTAKNIFSESLADYRTGDLLAALAKLPDKAATGTDAEKIYRASVLLSGGQIRPAQAALSELKTAPENIQRLAGALQQLIAAVKHEPFIPANSPQLASEFLAASYYAQSQPGPKSLEDALRLARKAVEKSPEFGFGWARVAELEFSFGRTERAQSAVEQALRFSPRNAAALSLMGFLYAAQNKTPAAIAEFDRALAIDSALGNAWLGRGLCRIRRGEAQLGREDLLTAAAMEPQRSALRSYLGKAFADAGDTHHATNELKLAKELDPNDPTPWLYSALMNEQNNQVNDAVRELEKSQELNRNRSVYRSGMLLDQDRAVRSANLARIYAEAGLEDFALREAGASVAKNYGSFGAHLFLANAYQQQAPAGPFGRRYETPAFNESLITALLGPVDGRIISPGVGLQEYTRLFERDGAHVSSSSEYLSRGALTQYGSYYGTFGGTSYAVEANYLSDPGQAANAQLEFHSFSAKIKEALTPRDSVFFQVYESSWQGGDVAQHYDPASTVAGYQFKEEQLPNVLLGYHHEWSADSHTLFLASRFDDRTDFFLPAGRAIFLLANPGLPPLQGVLGSVARQFSRDYTANSFELQQVQKIEAHTLVAGARFQINEEDISNQDTAFSDNYILPSTPLVFPQQSDRVGNDRASFYLLDFWRVNDHWVLFGGVDAEYVRLARNTIAPPLSAEHDVTHPVTPRAGLLWQPSSRFDLSLAYAESVTGQDLDQSVRLEPADFAGLPLTFRTAVPDSLAGGTSGERIKVWHASSRFLIGKNTYGVMGFQHLQSSLEREVGSYTAPPISSDPPSPSHTRERLEFKEESLQFSLRHLFGPRLSVGLRYEVARAQFKENLAIDPNIFIFDGNRGRYDYEGVLQTLTLDALANLPNGLFAGASATWRGQSELKDTTIQSESLAGDDFWQVDIFAGYRSPQRHFELRVGLLNVASTGYRLHPINTHPDLPRQQTLALSLRFNF
jgi:tetratricopeptide (TPR) repeat protein